MAAGRSSTADFKHTVKSAISQPTKMEAKNCERFDDASAGAKAARDEFFETIITDMLKNVPCPPEWDTDSIAVMARHGNWKELLRDKLIETANQSTDPIDALNRAATNTHTALHKIFTCRRGFGRVKTLFCNPEKSKADGIMADLQKEIARIEKQMKDQFTADFSPKDIAALADLHGKHMAVMTDPNTKFDRRNATNTPY